MPRPKILTLVVAAALVAFTADASVARQKKHHVRHHVAATETYSGFWSNLVPTDRNGTPIIMKGYRSAAPAVRQDEDQPPRRADRRVHIPRGSSSFVDIPPVNPSPYSSNSPPAAALTHPTMQPYNPPPINTFSDRVTNAIHAYPLQNGIGNNPTDQQSFIRQRVNQ